MPCVSGRGEWMLGRKSVAGRTVSGKVPGAGEKAFTLRTSLCLKVAEDRTYQGGLTTYFY
jgi:hypothetical protein